MVQRCARCDELNPRRSRRLPGDWVAYLERERDVAAPVGTYVAPLCREHDAAARDLPEAIDEETAGFLDALDPDHLVDEVAG